MPTTVSLAQLVDLSLGTPEIGAVNFNVMHTLLHAIIKKLNIGEVKTEINEHDRDFLATSKVRARSTLSMLSDADSGRGEESEDGLSEKSVPPFKPSPYHRLELKVEKLFEQMEELNRLPTNTQLFDRTTKARGEASDTPIADMWQYMQMKKRVDANEEGVGKVNFSLIYISIFVLNIYFRIRIFQALNFFTPRLGLSDTSPRLSDTSPWTFRPQFLLFPFFTY